MRPLWFFVSVVHASLFGCAQPDDKYTVPVFPDYERPASLGSWDYQETLNSTFLNTMIRVPDGSLNDTRFDQFQPSRHPLWHFELPLDWSKVDPFDDVNWRFNLQALRVVDPLLATDQVRLEGERLNQSLSIVRDWVEHYSLRPVDDSDSWQDMAMGLRMMRSAIVIRASLEHAVDQPDDLLVLERALLRQLHLAVHPDYYPRLSNHTIFLAHGVTVTCRLLAYLPGCPAYLEWAQSRIAKLVRQQFGSDGLHREHSPEYHLLALKTLRLVFATGWYDAMQDGALEVLRRAEAALPWLYDSENRLVRIGDSFPVRDKTGRAEISCGIDESDSEVSRCVRNRWFRDGGLAVSHVIGPRRESLHMACATHSNIHKHNDDLSFVWSVDGVAILDDAGKYGFQPGAERDFVTSWRAHNTIEFPVAKARRFRKSFPGACLIDVVADSSGMQVTGAIGREKSGVEHERTLRFSAGSGVLVKDEVRNWQGPFSIWWQWGPSVRTLETHKGWVLLGSDAGEFRFEYPAACNLDQHSGRKQPRLTGWRSDALHQLSRGMAFEIACEGSHQELRTRILRMSASSR